MGNINAHYYIEYTIESLDVERLEQMINLVKVTKKRYSFKEEYAISQTPQVVLDHHVRD